jgi:molecular chaperone GrpE
VSDDAATAGDGSVDPDLDAERGSEVEDYTDRIPRVEVPDDLSGLDAVGLTGFGDGDIADIDEDELSAETEASAATVEADADEVFAEVEHLKELVLRQQADFDNYRKRVASQSVTDIERATGRLAEALLPVLDAAEQAYVQHPDEVGPLLNQMLTELKKQGLESLELAGEPFDPEVADAVAHESGEGGDVTVAEVLRTGYTWKGTTLRPAMVRTTD